MRDGTVYVSQVLGPGIARATAGQDAVFGIEARDEMKNKRLCGGDEFAVKLVGPGGVTVHGAVQDNEDGAHAFMSLRPPPAALPIPTSL